MQLLLDKQLPLKTIRTYVLTADSFEFLRLVFKVVAPGKKIRIKMG